MGVGDDNKMEPAMGKEEIGNELQSQPHLGLEGQGGE